MVVVSVTVIREAWPASASSTELSSTSQIRWWRPSGPVDPMSRGGMCEEEGNYVCVMMDDLVC